ncbi:MAG: LruC domain-containing protein, partial [Butyricimonas faecihominis]
NKSDIDNTKIENSSSTALNENGMEINQDKPTFMLFDDIQQAVKNGAITVTLELAGKNSINDVSRKKLYNPFICVSTDGFNATSKEARREIHLTNYPPTPFANLYFFGRNNDKSSLDQEGNPIGPNYYVAEDNYPFAIDLPITDYQIPDESVKIDKFYPGFYKWAKSKGEENKDWYEYPASK